MRFLVLQFIFAVAFMKLHQLHYSCGVKEVKEVFRVDWMSWLVVGSNSKDLNVVGNAFYSF